MAADLSIGIALELAEFNRQFATLGPTAEKEAKLMAAGIRRQLKEAERAAKQSSDKMGKDLGGSLDKVGNISQRVLEKMGGQWGDLGDVIFDILGPLGQINPALLGVGAAALTAAVGVGVVAAGAVALGDAILDVAAGANEAAQQLEEMGLAALIPPESLTDLNEYNVGLHELAVEADRLRLALGDDIADDVGFLSFELANLLSIIREHESEIETLARLYQGFQTGGVGFLAQGIGELTSGLLDEERQQYETTAAGLAAAEAAKSQTAEVVKLAGAYRDQAEAEREMLIALGILIPDSEVDAGIKRRQKEETDALREATEKLKREEKELADALKADNFSDPTKLIELQTEKTWDLVNAQIAYNRKVEDMPRVAAEASAQFQALSGQWGEAIKKQTEDTIKAIAKVVLDVGMEIGDNLLRINDNVIRGYEDRIAAGEQLSAAEIRELDKAKDRAKAGAIAQAAFNSAIAGAGVAANLAPFIGPFAIGAGIAAGAGLFASAVAAINSESAMQFNANDYLNFVDPEVAAQKGLEAAEDMDEEDFNRGGKDDRDDVQSRTGRGGGLMVTVDPRLSQLRVVPDRRIGKTPRGGK